MDTMKCPFLLRKDLTCQTTNTPLLFDSATSKENCQRMKGAKNSILISWLESLKREDAEDVNDDGIEGERWYIPHQGDFHSRKPENSG